MKECTTHHHACDCREAAHAEEVARLKARNKELTAALEEGADLIQARMITLGEFNMGSKIVRWRRKATTLLGESGE